MEIKSEHEEQVLAVNWLENNGCLVWAIPNGMWQKSFKQLKKLKDEGMRKGIADLWVVLPANNAIDGVGRGFWLEMKKEKGGVVSDSQKAFIDAVGKIDGEIYGFVCKGFLQVKEVIEPFLKIKEKGDF